MPAIIWLMLAPFIWFAMLGASILALMTALDIRSASIKYYHRFIRG